MRTTVTLDRDVEVPIRDRMRERGISFKEALNEALRAGLTQRQGGKAQRFRLRTFRMGFRPEAALDQALSLAAAAEDEEIIRKLSLRK
jgi:hypothetical protein